MSDEYEIDKIVEETTFDPRSGAPTTSIRVTYRVGVDGPFSRLYQKDTFSPSRARSDIEEFARDLKSLRHT